MLLSLALLIAMAARVVECATANVALGYGVLLDPYEGKSPCVITVDVPKGQSADNCVLEVYVDSRLNRQYTVFGKAAIDGFTFDPLADQLKGVFAQPHRWSLPCKNAGTYVIGTAVTDSAASLGRVDSLSVARKLGDDYHVVPQRKKKTGEFVVAENSWVVFHVSLDTVASPWFDVDLSSSSKLDGVRLFMSRGDVTRDANRTEISFDATLDAQAKDLDAGQYQFGFTTTRSVAGSFTRFRVSFDLNNEVSDADDFPALDCPSELCGAPEQQSCRACTQGSCSWCPETRTCSNHESACAAPFVRDVKTCPNNADKCALLDCERCTADRDCVFCERGTLAGGSFCSSGKNDLAAECPSGLTNPTEIKETAKCPEVVKETFESADRRCAMKPSCSACAEDPTCTFCRAKVGNNRCTASKTCDSAVFSTVINATAQCPDVQTCGALTKCITCAADATCGWCEQTNSCLPKTSECRKPPSAGAAVVVAPLVTNGTMCSRTCVGAACDCSQYRACTNCTTQAHCIFCINPISLSGSCIDSNGSLACPTVLERAKTQCENCPEYPDPFCPRNDALRSALSVAVVAVAALLAALLH